MPPTAIATVIGVTKAYCTRVGGGPFPTGVTRRSTGDQIRKKGNEFGAVTGRPRRTGWIDLPLLRYSNMINGTSWLVVTKLDVLDELTEIPGVTAYKIDGKETDEIPAQAGSYDKIEPVYTNVPGGTRRPTGSIAVTSLPEKAKQYLAFWRRRRGAKVGIISTGPDREQTMFTDEFARMLDDRRSEVGPSFDSCPAYLSPQCRR